ncbi:formimidoylglutamase [Cecembia rubra]|uniref:Formimidoylglutamase n=1 Tax=Cecembia rubra TaxID=1485585 RepID=A0A2P8EAH1_9BACT|nr:formimidoylglutamase [Cecembia rubra]PSL06437.1 formiminoglutamase [Cecembia rubra]
MSIYQVANPSLWSGRKADTIQYWHHAVTCLSSPEIPVGTQEKKVAILGYQGEEGVRRNQGRIGTAQGPDQVRKMMGPLAYHLPKSIKVYDMGNFRTEGGQMEGTHSVIFATVKKILSQKVFPVIIGGGHDLAFPHGHAVIEYCLEKGEKLGIINLDAHFDLRPTLGGQGHSGSPFFQLGNKYPKDFHYFCIGIQRAANPPQLFEIAKSMKVQWMEAEELTLNNWSQIAEQIDRFCQQVNKIYLSIDMDGFSSAFAPGVSAPSPWGFQPDLAAKVVQMIARSGKLISLDIVELNPAYDIDNSTSRLAARVIEYALRNILSE